jgi:hypothetical protein
VASFCRYRNGSSENQPWESLGRWNEIKLVIKYVNAQGTVLRSAIDSAYTWWIPWTPGIAIGELLRVPPISWSAPTRGQAFGWWGLETEILLVNSAWLSRL